jgi:Na+-driven multidrug efflux pump
MSSSISKLIGADRKEYAITHAMNIYYFAFIVSLPICILGYIYTLEMLALIWANGSTLEYAINYFRIILFVYPLTLIWMSSVGLLRWLGDAKKSMMPTLIAGWVNIILDPIFIFWFDWWIESAAWATAISRLALFWVAFYWVHLFLYMSMLWVLWSVLLLVKIIEHVYLKEQKRLKKINYYFKYICNNSNYFADCIKSNNYISISINWWWSYVIKII